jgi:hypothetical protein
MRHPEALRLSSMKDSNGLRAEGETLYLRSSEITTKPLRGEGGWSLAYRRPQGHFN